MILLDDIQQAVTNHLEDSHSNEIDETAIILGETYAAQFFPIIESLMELHIHYLDTLILTMWEHEEFDKFRHQLLELRGFTWTEYQELFDTNVPIDLGKKLIFRILKIINQKDRDHFISQYQNNEADYLAALFHHAPIGVLFFSAMPAHIRLSDLQTHCYIAGKTKVGKSEVMKSIWYAIQRDSHSSEDCAMVLLDPHGDLSNEILALHLNQENPDRVVFVDPYASNTRTPVLNPLHIEDKSERSISQYIQSFVKAFGEMLEDVNITMNMEAILVPMLFVLLEREGSTLEDLQQFLMGDETLVALGQKHPKHGQFFKDGFHSKFYSSTKQSIFTKIQKFLNYPSFRSMTSGPNTLDLEQAINDKKIIIFRLTKAEEEASTAMSKFIIARLLAIVLKRTTISKSQRVPCYLFLDEFQNYANESINQILEEARKFKLHLIFANQTLSQITSPKMRDSIMANTNVKIIGKSSDKNLNDFSKELRVSVDDLHALHKYHFYVKTGDRTAYQFKSSAALLHQPGSAFYMSPAELQALKQRIIGSEWYTEKERSKPRSEREGLNQEEGQVEQIHTEPSNYPEPKYKF